MTAGDTAYMPEGAVRRRIPRTLAGAAHVTAAGAWAFVIGVLLLKLALTGLDSVAGFFVSLVLLVVAGPFVLGLLFGGLAVAFVGTTVTLPLAIAWWRTPNREGNGGFALANFALALLATAFVLLRLML